MSLSKTQAAIVLFLSLVVGMWWLVTFQYSMKWDIMDITLPWNHFISESIRGGELPLWNPYLKNGFPMMGLPDTWYPITWVISILFGMDVWGIQMDYLLHLFIGGYGMFSYAKSKYIDPNYSVALGVAYMFSGVMIGNAQHLGWVIGASWLPWVYYYFENLVNRQRKIDLLKFSLVASLLFYGAYPPITIIIFYLLVLRIIFLIFRKPEVRSKNAIVYFGFSVLLTLMISLVGLLGLLDLAPNLNRGGQLPLSKEGWGVLSGFLPLEATSSLIVPYAVNCVKSHWGSDISLINCYFGFSILLVMIAGLVLRVKQAWIYFSIGAFFLMVAMSEVFPFREWLYYLPLFDKFRFPSLFRVFAIFFFLLSSGFAYTEIVKSKSIGKTFRYLLGFLFFIFLVLASFSYLRDGLNIGDLFDGGLQNFNTKASYFDRASVNLIIHLLWIGGLLMCSVVSKRWFQYLPLFVILEAVIISQFNISETVIHFGDPKIGNHEIQKYEGRPISLDLIKPMNTFDDGYWDGDLSWFRFNQASITKTPSASGSSPFSLLSTKEAKANGDYGLNNYPLLFLAEIVDQKVVESSIDQRSYEHIKISSNSHNEFILQVSAEKETNLIFLQNSYDGWSVTIDTEPVKINMVNTTFMSIPLEAGVSNVRIFFRPTNMIVTFWISLGSFLIVLMGVGWKGIVSFKT